MALRSNWLVNGLIAALALATSVLVVVTDDKPTTEELEERARNLLPDFPRAELRALSARRGERNFSVSRAPTKDPSESRYVFTGEALEADPDAVTALIRSLELAGYVRRLDANEDDREAFGLRNPSATLGVEFARVRYELRFGNEARTPQGTRYLEVTGADASRSTYLVRSELLNELVPEKDALRPRALLRIPFSALRALRWQEGSAPATELQRASGVEFLNSAGERVPRDSVDRLALSLTRTSIARFTADAPARAALDSDAGALSLTLTPAGDAAETRFRIGGKCPEDAELEVLVRQGADAERGSACVSPELRRAFRDLGSALRDDAPFVLHADEVESLRLERKGKSLELVRQEKGFRLLTPSEQDVELDTGNGRIEELVRARGERVEKPNLAALGLSPAEGTLRLRSSVVEGSPKYEESVEIGRAAQDGRLPVRRVKDGVTLLLPAEAARAYAVDSTLLKSRHLFDFGPSELARLTIEFGGERQTLERVEGSYRLVEPRGFEHDGERTLELIQALATLLADRWVAEQPEARHGLSEPKATLTLELTPAGQPPKRVTLRIGAETAGGAFAALDTEPGVFVLRRAFVTRATTLVLSRAVFEVDPSALSLVTLSNSKKTLELRRAGDHFEDRTGTLSAPAIERLAQTLENLHAEEALHTGPARPSEGLETPTLTLRLTPADTTQKTKTLRVGSALVRRDQKLFHARLDGVNATYLIPASALDELLNAL